MEELFTSNTWYKRGDSWKHVGLIARVMGLLLYIEAGLLLVCTLVSLCYNESEYIYFVQTIVLLLVVGSGLVIAGWRCRVPLTQRDSYFIVAVTWILFTAFGMLPFYLSGHIPSVADAFFETMSGFTTTGASILDNIESLPYGMLFWRSFTQWIGGLGIVFFTIALLPIFGGGSQQLFLSEATGVTYSKTHPKVRVMARWLWMIYFVLTLLEVIFLLLGGMNLFDAVCHSFSTTATGGYSTKQDSVAFWDSAYIEYVISIFMILSGVNFSLYLFLLKGNYKLILKDSELHWFLKSVGIITLIITVALVYQNGYDWELAFRKALFQVATTHTSCGFVTDDFNLWPPFTWLLLLFAMISGGCTGSTSGGIKNMRLCILVQNVKNQFKQILHPHAVLPIKINRKTIDPQLSSNVLTFIVTYLLCAGGGWLVLMFFGVGLTESLSTVVSAIGNVGPGLGAFGPIYSWAALPDAAKWVLSALMLIGRLELFGVLLLFYPGMWKNR